MQGRERQAVWPLATGQAGPYICPWGYVFGKQSFFRFAEFLPLHFALSFSTTGLLERFVELSCVLFFLVWSLLCPWWMRWYLLTCLNIISIQVLLVKFARVSRILRSFL